MSRRILVTGAGGQVGTSLTAFLKERYGCANVVAADYHKIQFQETDPERISINFDVGNIDDIENAVVDHNIGTIYHLAGVLSAVAESNQHKAWSVNVDGLRNVLDVSRKYSCSVFFPSSIAAFSPESHQNNTPQDTIMRPRCIYGITKVTGELLCNYYFQHFGVDTRGLRFPGLISYDAMPGGGTTDYSVNIFHAAIKEKSYTCFLKNDTYLDMMYMPDAVRAAVELMEADPDKLIHRNAYNVSSMSFSPEELASAIQKIIPDFKMDYSVDPLRQEIADSWPNKTDDRAAASEWGWKPEFDIDTMTRDMLNKLRLQLRIKNEK